MLHEQITAKSRENATVSGVLGTPLENFPWFTEE